MMMHYGSLNVGDTVPVETEADARALYRPGEPRWHGVVVPPMREGQCEAWLERRGVYSFHPVTYRTVTIRGKRKRIESRYLPGYVFARFPGPAIWHRVMASLFVADAIRMSSGDPAILAPADLTNIHAMRAIDEAAEEARRNAAKIRRGDRVRMLSGIFEGEAVEVLSLDNGRVKIGMTLFGAEREADVAVDMIEKINPLPDDATGGIYFPK